MFLGSKIVYRDNSSLNTRVLKPDLTSPTVGENATQYVFYAGDTQFQATVEQRNFLRNANPNISLSGKSLKATVSLVVGIQHRHKTGSKGEAIDIVTGETIIVSPAPYSYLTDYKKGICLFYMGFVVRLFDEVDGKMVEINDPILDGEFMGNIYYEYNIIKNTTKAITTYDDIDLFNIYSSSNEYIIVEDDKCFNRLSNSIGDVVISVKKGALTFKLDSKTTHTITDLNL